MDKNRPTILVVFGATGDLMERKLVPALFHLFVDGWLPPLFSVVGFSRRPLSDGDFQELIHKAVVKHLGGDVLDNEFLKLFHYQQGDFNNDRDYQNLAARLGKIDDQWRVCANKLFYPAVPPRYNATIFRNLAASGLTRPCNDEEGWTRVIVEKPFGKDLKEAQELDRLLSELFREEQIFRIDHYLAKEILQNILTFRFANNLLEDVWNNRHVEKIEIMLWEAIGIEGRGDFYDGLGALQDVGQNHLLQMLALAVMENPVKITPRNIRQKRAEALSRLHILNDEEIKVNSIRGQYEGFTEESGVRKDSATETYFKIKTYLDFPRWEGVPIILESGKKMPRTQKEIAVTFKHPQPCLCPEGAAEHFTNILRFRLEPDPGISIRFWSKRPGATMDVEEQFLDFTYKDLKERGRYAEEYARLLVDCIAGDQTLFVSSEETKAGWEFIDPIVEAWGRNVIPLQKYAPESATVLSEQIGHPLAIERRPLGKIGVVGLGKMGGNIARRLLELGWKVIGFNRTAAVTSRMVDEGLTPVYSLKELAEKIDPPRVVWLMLPAGPVVDEMIFGENGLTSYLQPGDVIIDAGNSFYKDTVRRFNKLKDQGLHFVDVGFSGGPEGARRGGSLMVGGDIEAYESLKSLFTDLAVPGGRQYFGGPGAGHFVKMVHNGIEYGMMQAIAEGFTLLSESDYGLDLVRVADVYNHGSVIESRLIGWLKQAYELYGRELKDISGVVGHTGEADWTLAVAKELNLKLDVIEESLKFRIQSEKTPSYTGKILSALRQQFGGHSVEDG